MFILLITLCRALSLVPLTLNIDLCKGIDNKLEVYLVSDISNNFVGYTYHLENNGSFTYKMTLEKNSIILNQDTLRMIRREYDTVKLIFHRNTFTLMGDRLLSKERTTYDESGCEYIDITIDIKEGVELILYLMEYKNIFLEHSQMGSTDPQEIR